MNGSKLTLLATAAFFAATVTAQADGLADLKSQIQALGQRAAQLETSSSIPASYQLLSISQADAIIVPSLDVDKHDSKTTSLISIQPTADIPANTQVFWSGYARAALVYRKDKYSYSSLIGLFPPLFPSLLPSDSNDLDIYSRGEIKIGGTTNTAVGEVGALVRLRGNFEGPGDAGVSMPEAWGWWRMTPELTLGGGYTSTLANISFGYDGACTCYYTDTAPLALPGGQETTQIRLSYESGPLSMAIALEDASQFIFVGQPFLYDPFSILGAEMLEVGKDNMGVAGEVRFAGEGFSAELSAGWWDTSGIPIYSQVFPGRLSTKDTYQVGAGIGFALGERVRVSMAAGLGELATGSDYWKASILAAAKLSDSIHAEIAYGHADHDRGTFYSDGLGDLVAAYANKTDALLAGLYYDPVPQLTVGLEGEWSSTKYSGLLVIPPGLVGTETVKQTSMQIDLVTVYRF